jgi:hypothetical protein
MFPGGRLPGPAIVAALIVAAAAATTLASPAAAGTTRSGATGLEYSAIPGEANRVLLRWAGDEVLVSDPGAALVLGCMPRTLTEVSCPTPGGPPTGASTPPCKLCVASVFLGDGNDIGEIRNAPLDPTLSVLLDGGDGDDQLSSNRGRVVGGSGNDALTGEVLEGGPGDDRLAGTNTDNLLDGGPGADLLKGMGGTDRTTYADRTGGVHVTLDGRSDDGEPGEGDDVETEDVNGGAGPDVLIGDDGRNALTGLCGDDRLTGGGGADVLEGGPGADTIDGRAGPFGTPDPPAAPCGPQPAAASDLVACGPGDDLVLAGAGDRVAADCERVYFSARDLPRLKIVTPAPAVARLRRGRIRIAVRDVTQASDLPTNGVLPVSATVSLRAAGGEPEGLLGRAELPRLDAGALARVAVPLTRTARRALRRRGGALRVAVTVTARDAAGAVSLTRRALAVAGG